MNHHKSGQQGPFEGSPGKPLDNSNGETPPGKPMERASAEPEPNAHPGKSRGQAPIANILDPRQSNKDIQPVLRGWDYEPGTLNVRKVNGVDGEPKLQMRLDLGLLQMEMNGRPDGRRPFGCESLLEYHEGRLADHKKRHGTDMGFQMNGADCQSLRDEAVMYYQRYLSLFVLEEFTAVVRDTARNLRVLDFCNQFAVEEDDKMILEQYRPYITMMNTRGKASIFVREKRFREAMMVIDGGLSIIRQFFEAYGQGEAFSQANEVKVLKRLARDIRKKVPVDPMQRLQRKLARAIKEERYEEAARLRDKIATMKGEPEGPRSTQTV